MGIIKPARVLVSFILVAFSVNVFATNGSFLIGYGAKSRGMGGAGVAFAQDALVSATNPAGMADIKIRLDGGLMVFNPDRSAHVPGFSGKPQITSGATLYGIPNMGFNYPFNRKISMGFAFVGAGGGGTRYNTNFFDFGITAGPTLGVNLAQAIMSPSVAYKINRNHSVGASLLLGIQTFRAFGLESFGDTGFSSDPANLTGRGNDWSYGAGARFGWRGKFLDNKLTLGAVYSSRMYMTKFDKYKGLFAEQGDADIPEHFAIGLAVMPIDKLTVAFDVQYINYDNIASFANDGPPVFNAAPPQLPPDQLMGADNGVGFGWESMIVYKLGFNYDLDKQWTVRAGWNFGEKPIPEGGVSGGLNILANTLAPATVEHHMTLGASYRPSKKLEFTGTLMYAFREEMVEFNNFSGDNINIGMDQLGAEVSVGYTF